MTFRGLVDGGPLDGSRSPVSSTEPRFVCFRTRSGVVLIGHGDNPDEAARLGGIVDSTVYWWAWGVWIADDQTR